MSRSRYWVGLLMLAVYGGVMVTVDFPWSILAGFIGGVVYGIIFEPVVRRRIRSPYGSLWADLNEYGERASRSTGSES